MLMRVLIAAAEHARVEKPKRNAVNSIQISQFKIHET